MYEVRLAGVLAARRLTLVGALATVTRKFHGKQRVTIEKNGRVIWQSKED